MEFTDDDRRRTLADLTAAPFEPERWQAAMAGLAAAGGGWTGQLLGVSPTRGVMFNWVSGLSADDLVEFEQRGGGIPGVNPRVKAGFELQVYSGVADDDFITESDRQRSPLYQELFKFYDAEFISLAKLAPLGDIQAFACSIRSGRQGHPDGGDIERMSLLAPAVSAALRLHATLEGRGAQLAAGAMEALSVPAVLLDAFGRIVASSVQVDAMLRDGGVIRARAGRLSASDPASDERLQIAVRRACGRGEVPAATISRVALRDSRDGAVVVEVAPLPRGAWATGLGPVVVVAFRAPARREGAAELLRQAFGLSPAEAEVALQLCRGDSPAQIAEIRGVSIETVRNQLKSIYDKAEVATQVGLAHAVTAIVGPVD